MQRESVPAAAQPSVLIAGAGFAGLAAAYWMKRLGYAVTVVETAPAVKKGGTPVNIRGGVLDVVRRMGLLERIAANSIDARSMEFLDERGVPVAIMRAGARDIEDGLEVEEYEIERDLLLDMLYDEVRDNVEFVFADSIASLDQTDDAVAVTFSSGRQGSYSLVLGCDGTHSAVRRMCFGEEFAYSMFLEHYFSLTIVKKLLIPENTGQMFNLPGRTVMLTAYHGKTDIGFCFLAEEPIGYDRRDRQQQREMIVRHFAGTGWRVEELLAEMAGSDDFYFDQLCQIRMDTWSKGRVALVGDAAYNPSPLAGMGGSMAILGAGALADAFARYPEDHRLAFAEYDRSFRPVAAQIQAHAVEFGLEMFMPRTAEAIERRNEQLRPTAS